MSIADDAIQVVLGGVGYQNWLDVDIDSDIFTPADAFGVTSTIPGSEIRDIFREGAKCDIYVGRDRQMAGVIDTAIPKGSRAQSRLRIVGRDRAAYLLDNDAPELTAENMTVKTLIEKLIDPAYGIKGVVLSAEDDRKLKLGKKDKKGVAASTPTIFTPIPRKHTRVDSDRKIAAIIDEHCARLGIAWWMTADGSLFIGKPNYKQGIAFRFQAAEGRDAATNNVLDWEVKYDQGERYSEIEVNGSGVPDKGGHFKTSKKASRWTATAKDQDLIDRNINRKLIIVDNEAQSQDEVQHRADLEQGRRRLNALVIKLTVPGFRQVDRTGVNRLFTIDTLASVRIDEYGINDTFYVTQRRFRETREGRRTELTLHRKGIWLP